VAASLHTNHTRHKHTHTRAHSLNRHTHAYTRAHTQPPPPSHPLSRHTRHTCIWPMTSLHSSHMAGEGAASPPALPSSLSAEPAREFVGTKRAAVSRAQGMGIAWYGRIAWEDSYVRRATCRVLLAIGNCLRRRRVEEDHCRRLRRLFEMRRKKRGENPTRRLPFFDSKEGGGDGGEGRGGSGEGSDRRGRRTSCRGQCPCTAPLRSAPRAPPSSRPCCS